MKNIALKNDDVERYLNIKTNNSKFYLRIYSDEEIKMFERLYDNLIELRDIFEGPTVGDVTLPKFKGLTQKFTRAVNNYNEYVPEEFKRKFGFDVEKLEKKILCLQKEFIKDLY